MTRHGAVSLFALSLLLLSTTAARSGGYHWSLSASSTDPQAYTAPPTTGFFDIFLWFDCDGWAEGISYAAFGIESDLAVTQFAVIEPAGTQIENGSGTAEEVILTISGCPTDMRVLGRFTVLDLTGNGGYLCFTTTGAGELITTSCNTLSGTPSYHGFANDGSDPCWTVWDCEYAGPPVSAGSGLTAESWSRVRTMYR